MPPRLSDDPEYETAKRARREAGERRKQYRRGTGALNPIDVHVGSRIRMRRLLLGMNQEKLADALGLTFQQVQKYEGGANRVGASRLSAMAEILRVPISYFFDEKPPDDAEISPEDRQWQEYLQRPETWEEAERLQEIDTILARVENGIAIERNAINALLDRLSSNAA